MLFLSGADKAPQKTTRLVRASRTPYLIYIVTTDTTNTKCVSLSTCGVQSKTLDLMPLSGCGILSVPQKGDAFMFNVQLTPEQVALIEEVRQANLEFDPDFSVSDAISAALNCYVGLVLME